MLKAEIVHQLIGEGDDPLLISPRKVLLPDKGPASIDLRLGCWFETLRESRMTHLKTGSARYVGQLTKSRYVRFGDKYILHPQTFVLGVTLEWVRLPGDLGAYIIGRSTWGRRGLIIATAAGVHPGFTGCLTLELTNLGAIPIELIPGMTICQLFFHRVQTLKKEEMDKSEFIGQRKPTVGSAKPDAVAKKLWKAHGESHKTQFYCTKSNEFRDFVKAQELKTRLVNTGYNACVMANEEHDSLMYTVLIGYHDSADEANEEVIELREKGIEATAQQVQ
ncbi:MAG: dCTP deaminase [bacterium]|nr:dCTP deaminase [bacterium]